MAAIVLTGFSGEQPRLVPRLLPNTAAQDAIDVRLDDGGLTPLMKPRTTGLNAVPNAKTITRHAGEWLSWTSVVNAVPGPVDQARLYITGDGPPKMRVANGTVYPLAVARPTAAPSASLTGGAGDVTTRLYVYTFVTAFGEESEPSAASNTVDWRSGATVTLTGIQAAPGGRNITLQRFYRSQTGSQGTFLYLIAERVASAANFIDNIAPSAFAEPLPSTDWNQPLDGLTGITALPNGLMAAFVGRDLFFCEPFRPHAWPDKYVLTTDYPIVGLGAIGGILVVMTTGTPYIVSGTDPASMQMVKTEQNLPCINARAIVDLGFSICYPSFEGLAAVRGDGSAQIVTANIFSRDEWLKLSPDQMTASHLAGRYVAFYDAVVDEISNVGAIALDISGQTPFITRSAIQASAACHDLESGGLYFVGKNDTEIVRMDPPTGVPALGYWRSKPFIMPAPENFGVIQVDAEAISNAALDQLEQDIADTRQRNTDKVLARATKGALGASAVNVRPVNGDTLRRLPTISTSVTVTVQADGINVRSTDVINKPVRLPSGFKARSWTIAVLSDIRIERIVLAHTIADLKLSPPG